MKAVYWLVIGVAFAILWPPVLVADVVCQWWERRSERRGRAAAAEFAHWEDKGWKSTPRTKTRFRVPGKRP